MRYWLYVEPAGKTSEPIFTVMSDAAILGEYWDYWCERMKSVGREHLINKEDCILDWVMLHWAVEATPEALLQIITAPKAENSEANNE